MHVFVSAVACAFIADRQPTKALHGTLCTGCRAVASGPAIDKEEERETKQIADDDYKAVEAIDVDQICALDASTRLTCCTALQHCCASTNSQCWHASCGLLVSNHTSSTSLCCTACLLVGMQQQQQCLLLLCLLAAVPAATSVAAGPLGTTSSASPTHSLLGRL
jgi:hypothetical protein